MNKEKDIQVSVKEAYGNAVSLLESGNYELAEKQLARFVYNYENNSIVYQENILINKRIRDIISLENGNILLLTDIGDEMTDHAEIILISKSEN